MKDNTILNDHQIALFQKIGGSKFLAGKFYLSGGTALAAFYLQHRYSEDLDFFSETEFDILQIDIFLKKTSGELHITKIDYEQSFNRNLFFLYFGKEVVKVEFTFFPFERIEKGIKEYNVDIDSILDIAVNKLFTIYQRCSARDYIDLYLICRTKGFAISDLAKKAKIKFDWHIDPLQLGTQFLKGEEAADHPRMIRQISSHEWRNFFVEEAKKLKSEILE